MEASRKVDVAAAHRAALRTALLRGAAAVHEPQRGSIHQPRVGAERLPWVTVPHISSTLKGLNGARAVAPGADDATPLGLGIIFLTEDPV